MTPLVQFRCPTFGKHKVQPIKQNHVAPLLTRAALSDCKIYIAYFIIIAKLNCAAEILTTKRIPMTFTKADRVWLCNILPTESSHLNEIMRHSHGPCARESYYVNSQLSRTNLFYFFTIWRRVFASLKITRGSFKTLPRETLFGEK